jgi:hypothetical protein
MNSLSNSTQHEPVLSRADLDFFHENGYVVVPNAVPRQNRENLIEALFQFLDVDRSNPDSWYQPPVCPSGMVEIFQHQALWDNRQHPRVHGAFADIFNDHDCGSASTAPRCARRNRRPTALQRQAVHALGHGFEESHARFLSRSGRFVSERFAAGLGGFTCVPASTKSSTNGSLRILKTSNRVAPIFRSFRPATSCSRFQPKLAISSSGICACLMATVTTFPISAIGAIHYDVPRGHKRKGARRSHSTLARATARFVGARRRARMGTTKRSNAELSPLGRKLLGLDLWDDVS